MLIFKGFNRGKPVVCLQNGKAGLRQGLTTHHALDIIVINHQHGQLFNIFMIHLGGGLLEFAMQGITDCFKLEFENPER